MVWQKAMKIKGEGRVKGEAGKIVVVAVQKK
jgi:hypothetical protein